MTIREKIDKFKPFFDRLSDLINDKTGIRYIPKNPMYIAEKRPANYIAIIQDFAPCITCDFEFIKSFSQKDRTGLHLNEIRHLLYTENLTGIEVDYLGTSDLIFVIPIEL